MYVVYNVGKSMLFFVISDGFQASYFLLLSVFFSAIAVILAVFASKGYSRLLVFVFGMAAIISGKMMIDQIKQGSDVLRFFSWFDQKE